jgi:hypothetical protein
MKKPRKQVRTRTLDGRETYAEWEARIDASVEAAAKEIRPRQGEPTASDPPPPASVRRGRTNLEEWNAMMVDRLKRRPPRHVEIVFTREEAILVKAALLLLNCIGLTGLPNLTAAAAGLDATLNGAYSKMKCECAKLPPETEDED